MLKGTFEINQKVIEIKEIGEKISNVISIEKFIENKNLFEDNSIEVMKKIAVLMDEYGDIGELIVTERHIDFKYNDTMKKIFLLDLSEKWIAEISMNTAINALEEVSKYEDKFGKSVLDFDEEEIKYSIIDMFSGLMYHKLRSTVNIIARLQEFYKDLKESEYEWRAYGKVEALRKTLGGKISQDIVTKKDLLNLISVMPNAQESIIPLLIFEGVNFSKVEEMDELRYLKASDVQGNKIIIHGKNSRVLDIDNEVAEALEKAINAEYLFKTVQHELRYIELEDTEFILRPSILSRKRKDTSYDMSVMSFRGVYSRFSLCREQIESTMYDVPFSPKAIENFGKVYYVTRYIADGLDMYEAIRKTLKRFGTWRYGGENENVTPHNVQLVNRLKNLWLVHSSTNQ